MYGFLIQVISENTEQVALYLKVMPNSIDFYKGIFLHVTPVRIIVSQLQ